MKDTAVKKTEDEYHTEKVLLLLTIRIKRTRKRNGKRRMKLAVKREESARGEGDRKPWELWMRV